MLIIANVCYVQENKDRGVSRGSNNQSCIFISNSNRSGAVAKLKSRQAKHHNCSTTITCSHQTHPPACASKFSTLQGGGHGPQATRKKRTKAISAGARCAQYSFYVDTSKPLKHSELTLRRKMGAFSVGSFFLFAFTDFFLLLTMAVDLTADG